MEWDVLLRRHHRLWRLVLKVDIQDITSLAMVNTLILLVVYFLTFIARVHRLALEVVSFSTPFAPIRTISAVLRVLSPSTDLRRISTMERVWTWANSSVLRLGAYHFPLSLWFSCIHHLSRSLLFARSTRCLSNLVTCSVAWPDRSQPRSKSTICSRPLDCNRLHRSDLLFEVFLKSSVVYNSRVASSQLR